MSRIDDVINTAGHRLSTGAMEEVLSGHPDVAECAVVGVADELKGQVPVGFVVAEGRRRPARGGASPPSWSPGSARRSARWPRSRTPAWCGPCPKTRSGKVLRGTIRSMADGEAWRMPATIEDPAVLDDFREVLIGLGRDPSAAAPA